MNPPETPHGTRRGLGTWSRVALHLFWLLPIESFPMWRLGWYKHFSNPDNVGAYYWWINVIIPLVSLSLMLWLKALPKYRLLFALFGIVNVIFALIANQGWIESRHIWYR